jgi:hypothetical protein
MDAKTERHLTPPEIAAMIGVDDRRVRRAASRVIGSPDVAVGSRRAYGPEQVRQIVVEVARTNGRPGRPRKR